MNVRMNEIETKSYHAKLMGEIVFSPVLLITRFCRQEFFSEYREEISSHLKLKSLFVWHESFNFNSN